MAHFCSSPSPVQAFFTNNQNQSTGRQQAGSHHFDGVDHDSVYCHEGDLEVEVGVGGDKTRNPPRSISKVCAPVSIKASYADGAQSLHMTSGKWEGLITWGHDDARLLSKAQL